MLVDTTSTKDFTQTDLDNGLLACSLLSGSNNTIGMGSAGDKLYGAVVAVGPDDNGDGIPDYVGGAEDGRFYYLRNPQTK